MHETWDEPGTKSNPQGGRPFDHKAAPPPVLAGQRRK